MRNNSFFDSGVEKRDRFFYNKKRYVIIVLSVQRGEHHAAIDTGFKKSVI